jgi:uncharacterized protein (TIGR02246 family)
VPIREVMMRVAISTVALSVLLGAASAPVRAAEADDPKVLVDGFIRAWNTHDMKALAELFIEDAEFVNAAGMWWKGRDAIQTMHERFHAARFKTSTLVETNTTVRMLRPDVAVLHFQSELSGARDANGILVPKRHGIMLIVAVKQADGWRIVSAQNTDSMPPV